MNVTKKCCFAGNDNRFIYLKDYLTDYEFITDGMADLIIASPRFDTSLVKSRLAKGGLLVGGKGFNYSPAYRTANSKITAYGALALAIKHLNKFPESLNVLITGFGFLGKAVCEVFKKTGAAITVLTTDSKEQSSALSKYKLITSPNFLPTDYDLIINTIPFPLLDTMYPVLSNTVAYMELASINGFTDNIWHFNFIDGARLPGRYAPRQSALNLYNEIIFLKGEA